MPYPNDRRKHDADAVDSLSPEYLAMLVACGGEVRAEDRPASSGAGTERRQRRRADDQAEGQTPPASENGTR
jgi:hypothetical protein